MELAVPGSLLIALAIAAWLVVTTPETARGTGRRHSGAVRVRLRCGFLSESTGPGTVRAAGDLSRPPGRRRIRPV